VKTRRFIIKTG